jgi:hypothetical protein
MGIRHQRSGAVLTAHVGLGSVSVAARRLVDES